MEIGSPEHKRLLRNGIIRVAVKTIFFGWLLGIALMLPSWVRENTFSTGLAYAGLVIIWVTLIYALLIAVKKARHTFTALKNVEADDPNKPV
ncbi:MAG: hypothetical protein ACP5D0_07875 [Hydrogenovibrio sp.]